MTAEQDITPSPTEEIYRYAPVPDGERRVDDVYRKLHDVIDVGRLADERIHSPLDQDFGPIMVVTRSEAPVGPDGKYDTMMYAVTSKYIINLQSGTRIEFEQARAKDMRPVTIGAQWQTIADMPPTKYPVHFVARARATGAYDPSAIDPDHDKPDRQATTVIGQQQLAAIFGEDADVG